MRKQLQGIPAVSVGQLRLQPAQAGDLAGDVPRVGHDGRQRDDQPDQQRRRRRASGSAINGHCRRTLSAFAWQCSTTQDQSRPQETGEKKGHQIPGQHVRRRPQVVGRIDHRVNDGLTERSGHANPHGV